MPGYDDSIHHILDNSFIIYSIFHSGVRLRLLSVSPGAGTYDVFEVSELFMHVHASVAGSYTVCDFGFFRI